MRTVGKDQVSTSMVRVNAPPVNASIVKAHKRPRWCDRRPSVYLLVIYKIVQVLFTRVYRNIGLEYCMFTFTDEADAGQQV